MASFPIKIEPPGECQECPGPVNNQPQPKLSPRRKLNFVRDSRNGDYMTRVVHEMRKWLEQETFQFPSLPLHFYGNINDVNSIYYLLLLLSDFLKNTRKSEDECVVELMSDFVQNPDSVRNLIWWTLTLKEQEIGMIAREILGPKLSYLHSKYTSSRNQLEFKVDWMLGMLRSWTDAYSNGQAFGELVHLYAILCNVRQKFQAWIEGVVMAKAHRPCCHENRPILTMENIIQKVATIQAEVARICPIQVLSFPSASSDFPALGQPLLTTRKCTITCMINTEFLLVSRDIPPTESPIPALFTRFHDRDELIPKYLAEEMRSTFQSSSVSNHFTTSDFPNFLTFGHSQVPLASPSPYFPGICDYFSNSPFGSMSFSLSKLGDDVWDTSNFGISVKTEDTREEITGDQDDFASFNHESRCDLSPSIKEETDSDYSSHSSMNFQIGSPMRDDLQDDSVLVCPSNVYQELVSAGCDIEQVQFACFLTNIIRLAHLVEKEK